MATKELGSLYNPQGLQEKWYARMGERRVISIIIRIPVKADADP
jgi:hypothetical protein